MATANPPYMTATGNVSKILGKIKEARTPERFTQDFLETALGFSGGSSRPFISLAKRLGLLGSDGTPTDLYRQFRNPETSGAAIASAMRKGYDDLYRRNEYVHSLDRKKLEGLVAEVTGLEAGSPTTRAIVSTFIALKDLADFDAQLDAEASSSEDEVRTTARDLLEPAPHRVSGLRLSTTVYLNLPNTSDPAVFNAIFKALRENLLD